ncbi:hypothetical protein M405DRAFT_869666 [Rhizopogon salebrosus TDB-379]|nr:hypothetical protein M405DRAFT_869666 [Rhizopogon salebrosus TDB-379]
MAPTEIQMVAVEWTTPEQKDWLTNKLPAYEKCASKEASSARRSLANFWPSIYENWEKNWTERKVLWPELDTVAHLTEEQAQVYAEALKKRQKQLRTWFSWHSNRSASRKGRAAQTSTRAVRFLRDLLRPRGGRSLTEPEMYSRLYYASRVRPTVEAIIKSCSSTTRGERLTIIRDCTRSAWENEKDEQVIADVKASLAKVSQISTAGSGDGELEDEENDTQTEETLIEAQENLPAVFTSILEFLAHQTAFSFTVLMGGPDPSKDGEISISYFDIGKTPLGHAFHEFTPDFNSVILGRYLEFLKAVNATSTKSNVLNDTPDHRIDDNSHEGGTNEVVDDAMNDPTVVHDEDESDGLDSMNTACISLNSSTFTHDTSLPRDMHGFWKPARVAGMGTSRVWVGVHP